MDYLQYTINYFGVVSMKLRFKPYYKWITFNTLRRYCMILAFISFKPYYKWITFNTYTQSIQLS